MVFPKTERIYNYKGTDYIVHGIYPFWLVICQNILNDNNIHSNSSFYSFNWWKFIWNAKFIRKNKLNDAY